MLHITPWERTALQLLAKGIATREIANRFGTGEDEVEAEALAAAFRRGLLAAD